MYPIKPGRAGHGTALLPICARAGCAISAVVVTKVSNRILSPGTMLFLEVLRNDEQIGMWRAETKICLTRVCSRGLYYEFVKFDPPGVYESHVRRRLARLIKKMNLDGNFSRFITKNLALAYYRVIWVFQSS